MESKPELIEQSFLIKSIDYKNKNDMCGVIQLKNYFNEIGFYKRIITNHSNIDVVKSDIIKRSKLSNEDIFKYPALYEMLQLDDHYNRVFLDIENIPRDNRTIIKDIIKSFSNLLEIEGEYLSNAMDGTFIFQRDFNNDYVVTINEHSSSHEGLSYHVIYKNIYFRDRECYKVFLVKFLNLYQDYTKYVDTSIYTSTRLFRLPYSKNIKSSKDNKKKIVSSDVHRPYDIEKDIYLQIDESKITDYFISYYELNKSLTLLENEYHRKDNLDFSILGEGNFSCVDNETDITGQVKKILEKLLRNRTEQEKDYLFEQTLLKLLNENKKKDENDK